MEHDDDLTPQQMRAELSPVSERFEAVEFGSETVIYDRDEADCWILADCAVTRDELR
jgi:hypothetical protein